MKKSSKRFPVALITALVAVALSVAAVIVAIVASSVDILAVLDNGETMLNLFKCFDFHDTSLPTLVSLIGLTVIEVLFVVVLILLIVKRKPLFLIPLFLFEAAGAVAAMMVFKVVGGMAVDSLVLTILSYAGLGVALLAGLISLICLAGYKKEQEKAKPVEAPRAEPEPVPAPEPVAPSSEKQAPIEYVEPNAPLNYAEEESEDEEVSPEPVPAVENSVQNAKGQKILGKYEIYPEAGFFKYRLKANNGEVLLVSHGYKTREGARAGILTLQKNVPSGISKIITDKNGFSQFRIFTQNDSRLIVAGEFYGSSASAQKALNSVQRFNLTGKIVDIEEIPESEQREWKVDLPPMNPTKNGKFEVYIEEESKKWQGRLVANNGAVLFVTSTYSSKNAVLNAFDNIKNKVVAGDLDIARDKQNRYHFRIISENGSVILMGETYPSRESAISAAVSVRNFIGDAKIIDLSRGA